MAASIGMRCLFSKNVVQSLVDRLANHHICGATVVFRNVCERNKSSGTSSGYMHKIHPPKDINREQSFSTSLAIQYADSGEEESALDLLNKINSQVSCNDVGRLFAVIHVAGKQRKITNEDIIVLNKHIEADIGDKITLNKVLMVGSKDFSLIGKPVLSSNLVKVEATVIEKTLSHTVISFRYRRREDFRRMSLRKVPYTYLRINTIQLKPLHESG